MATELETHQAALDKFIKEYQEDKSEFWLHHIKVAIDNVLYLNKQLNQSLKG